MVKKLSTRKIGLAIVLSLLLIGFTGLVFSSYKIYAANLTAGPLSISYAGDQLFNESNIAPGDEVVKDLTVTNNGTLPHSFSISASNVTGNLADIIQIEPRENGLAFWNETLASLALLPNGSKVIISSIDPGATRNLKIAAIFPTSAGNAYQDQSVVNFSFTLGTESTDTPEPTGNPSPPPGITFGQRVLSAITYNPPATGGESVGGTGEQSSGAGGTVAGEETGTRGATTQARSLCFWWLVILIILIVSLIIYHRYNKEEKPAFWWIWPIVMAVVLFFVQYYFDRSYQKTIFCQYFWAVEAVVLIVYYLLEAAVFNKSSE